jgi:hypothetical protein
MGSTAVLRLTAGGAAATAKTNLRQRLFRLKQHSGSEIVVSDPVMALADGVHHDLESTAPELDAADTHQRAKSAHAASSVVCGGGAGSSAGFSALRNYWRCRRSFERMHAHLGTPTF